MTAAKVAAAVVVVAAGMIPPAVAADHGKTPAGVVLEDAPGWDCATMGNRVCGK